MSDATTRAHVASPTASGAMIPADPESKNVEPTTPDATDTEEALKTTTPLSRKERRKNKKQKSSATLPTPSDTENESEPTTPQRKPPNNPSKGCAPAIPPLMATPKAAEKTFSLLICSIGNPGATYANTFHSTGHTVIKEIAMRKSYKPFVKGLSGMVSRPDNTVLSWSLTGYSKSEGGPPEDDWTFWQSMSQMNTSGVGVKRAYTEWLPQIKAAGKEGRLVVVHDELEAELGKVVTKLSWASARGHHGLKSIQHQLGGTKWWRIGVGIGRPESREPAEVSRHVLRKMTAREISAVEKSTVGVVDALRAIAEGRR